MTKQPTSAEHSREWAEALGKAWRKDVEQVIAWMARLETGRSLESAAESAYARERACVAKRVPRFLGGYLDTHGDVDQGIERLSAVLGGKDPLGENQRAFDTHVVWYERLLMLYLGMAQGIAFQCGLYEPARSVPATWLYRDPLTRSSMPPIALSDVQFELPWKKCVRIRTISNAFRGSGQVHLFAEIVYLLDAICGADFDGDPKKVPRERLRGFDIAWTSSAGTESAATLGNKGKACRNLIHDLDVRKKLKIGPEQLAMASSILLYLLFLPWKYLMLLHRPPEAPGRYAVAELGGDGVRSHQSVLPGSALDASGWTGYLLWCPERQGRPEPGRWPRDPGHAPGPQVFRLMPLFPLFLGSDQYGLRSSSERGPRSRAHDVVHPVHILSYLKTGPEHLDMSVATFAPVAHRDTLLHSPVTLDARSRRTLVWIEMTGGARQSREFVKLLGKPGRAGDRRGRLSVHRAGTAPGGFPVAVHVLRLPAGPTRRGSSLARGPAQEESVVDCVLVYHPAPKRRDEVSDRLHRSWLLPRVGVSLMFKEEVLRELLAKRTDESRSGGGVAGLSAFHLYLLPQPNKDRSLELQSKLGELLDRSVRESPWVPDLHGKGNLRITIGSDCVDWPIIMEVHRGWLGDLLDSLDEAHSAIADTEFTSSWERPEVMVPWMLWVLVSASRGLEVLAGKRQEKRLGSVPIDPSHLRIDAAEDDFDGWWRLFDLEGALMQEDGASRQPAPPRWRPPGSDECVAGRAALAMLAHDMLYFAQHLTPPAGAGDWRSLSEASFDGWGTRAGAGLEDSETVARGLAARLGGSGDSSSYPTTSLEVPNDFAPLQQIRRTPSLSARLDRAVEEFGVCLKKAIDRVREDYRAAEMGTAASDRSPAALDEAMKAALRVSDVFQLSAYEALAESVRDEDQERYLLVRQYLLDLSRWGPYWSRPDCDYGAEEEAGPFAKRSLALQGLLRSADWGDGLDELVGILRTGFAEAPESCSKAGEGVTCHRSFAMTCPCTSPIRKLLHELPKVWDRPTRPSPTTPDYHVMASLDRLAEIALAPPEKTK